MNLRACLIGVSITCECGGDERANNGALCGNGLESSRFLTVMTGHSHLFFR